MNLHTNKRYTNIFNSCVYLITITFTLIAIHLNFAFANSPVFEHDALAPNTESEDVSSTSSINRDDTYSVANNRYEYLYLGRINDRDARIEFSSYSEHTTFDSTKFLELPEGNAATFQWSDSVSVIAADLNSIKIPVVLAEDGLSPGLSRNRGQIDYDAIAKSTESLFILFKHPANSIKLFIGMLEENELKNLDETGTWTTYDSNGIQLGQGIISPETQSNIEGSDSKKPIREFTVHTNEVSVLKLQATSYGNGKAPHQTKNNSDFNLFGIEFLSGQMSIRLKSTELGKSESTLPLSHDTIDKRKNNLSQKQIESEDNLSDSLPMGGMFYGNYEYGLYTGNASIGYESSRRFRAEKSGDITAVKYNNRTLSQENITTRCERSGSQSVWCKCESANLNHYSCGYTLGNSYTVGNGGSIVIEIYEDNGGLPGGKPLGKTEGIFIPQENAAIHYPSLTLESEVSLTAGKLYHLVYRNLSPPENCSLTRVSVEEASKCDESAGAMSLNGTLFANSGRSMGIFDPYRGDSSANFFKAERDGEWLRDFNNLSWYEVQYTDGTWVGDSYAAYDSHTTGARNIEAQVHGRQRFTVTDVDRVVDGLWLNIGHKPAPKANGEPLSVAIKDSSGHTLATGIVSASETCTEMAPGGMKSQKVGELNCRDWIYTALSNQVILAKNKEYSVELHSAKGAGFVLSAYFPLDYGVWNSTSSNHWSNSKAEVSVDNGQTWTNWTDSYPDRDLGLLFTIKGQPRSLY